jgi:hypothetical protein
LSRPRSQRLTVSRVTLSRLANVPWVNLKLFRRRLISLGPSGALYVPCSSFLTQFYNLSSRSPKKGKHQQWSAKSRDVRLLCLGTYGSNDSNVNVIPEPIMGRKCLLSSDWTGFTGQRSRFRKMLADTPGRFEVARRIALCVSSYDFPVSKPSKQQRNCLCSQSTSRLNGPSFPCVIQIRVF